MDVIYAKVAKELGEEYVNSRHVFNNLQLLSQDEIQLLGETEYMNSAWLATLRWRDYMASNAFGGKRQGKNRKQLITELESTRKYYEELLVIKIAPFTKACTEQWYEEVWANIFAQEEKHENKVK